MYNEQNAGFLTTEFSIKYEIHGMNCEMHNGFEALKADRAADLPRYNLGWKKFNYLKNMARIIHYVATSPLLAL